MPRAMIKFFPLAGVASRGYILTPIELAEKIPFAVRRIYWLVGQELSTTGQHCHFAEEEVFVCVVGQVKFLWDVGQGKEEKTLETGDAVYVAPQVWHGFTAIPGGAVVVALSSTSYSADRSDYCENYEEFLEKWRSVSGS